MKSNNLTSLEYLIILTCILATAINEMMGSEVRHKVFVYGTLKKGEPNHSWFSKNTDGVYKYLTEAQTIEKYPLIIATKYNIPFILASPGNGYNVKGELYEVDDKVLTNLDILEDHPDFYIRKMYSVLCLNQQNITDKAWIYMIEKFSPNLLNATFFDNYSSLGSHGKKYVERYNRDSSYDSRGELIGISQN